MRYRALLIAMGLAVTLAACGTHPPDQNLDRIPVANGNEPVATYGYGLAAVPPKAPKNAEGKEAAAEKPVWTAETFRRVQQIQGSCFDSIGQKYRGTRAQVVEVAKKRAAKYPTHLRSALIEQTLTEHYKDIGEAGGDCNVKMLEHVQKDGELEGLVPYHANDVVPDNPLPVPSN